MTLFSITLTLTGAPVDKTEPIVVKDGFVTFTVHFKYLGS